MRTPLRRPDRHFAFRVANVRYESDYFCAESRLPLDKSFSTFGTTLSAGSVVLMFLELRYSEVVYVRVCLPNDSVRFVPKRTSIL